MEFGEWNSGDTILNYLADECLLSDLKTILGLDLRPLHPDPKAPEKIREY